MKLVRVATTDTATFGVLIDADGVPFAVTLEHPWRDANKDGLGDRGVSRIPTGSYRCVRYHSPKFPNTFEITGVPGRSAILFHTGNTPADTQGCVLVGESFDVVSGVPGVTQSKKGFAEFLDKARGDAFTLDVVSVP